MANDPAQDRYDPPKVGSEFEEEIFSEVSPGELFRLSPYNEFKMYRRSDGLLAFDLKERVDTTFAPNTKVYVKS